MKALPPLAGNPSVSCNHACHRRRTPPSGGTDYAVAVGTPIFAPVDGFLYWMTNAAAGWGLRLRSGSTDLVFAHLSSRPLASGAKVRQGDLIGYTGGARGHPGAGSSTGPHLHAEVQRGKGREGMDEWLAEMNGPEWAGGGTTPIEGDDMQADEREALFQIRDVLGARGGLNTDTRQSVAFLVRDLSKALTAHIPAETKRQQDTIAAVQKLLRYVVDGGEDVKGTIGSPDSIFGLTLRILGALGRGGELAPADVAAIRSDIAKVPEQTLAAFGLQRTVGGQDG